jgi:hypothetical protein
MGSGALITLGKIYISEFLPAGAHPSYEPHDLVLEMDKDGAAHLSEHVPVNKMFGKYWYRSGTNESMRRALEDVVRSITSLPERRSGVWLDIASNDGTLLSFVPESFERIGIDPCEVSFLEEARKHGTIIQDYFSADSYARATKKKANVITSIAMFYDVVDREQFLEDIYDTLADNGLWVLQLSYTPLMLRQLAFDNICHEHYYYYSLKNIKRLFERYGFKIMDCVLNDVNGGSFRLYVMKSSANNEAFAGKPYRDVCDMRIDSLLELEETIKPDAPFTWLVFLKDILKLGRELKDFIVAQKAMGKTIWGYGASTKGNTLLQYFDINSGHLDAIADRSPYKQGLYTVGTNIPIKSEEEMRQADPDYLFILPWHFIDEFVEREKEYLFKGGAFIVPCPKLKIISRQATDGEIESWVYSNTYQETSPEIEAYIRKLKNCRK